jgi:hypothetical protein
MSARPRTGDLEAGVIVLRVAAPAGAALMLATIVLALASGASLGTDGSTIAGTVWGRVTFVDLGLALVAGWAWIAWRERTLPRALLWLVLTTVTGSLAILGYLALAAWRERTVREALGRRTERSVGH